jgi:hypothetical protein
MGFLVRKINRGFRSKSATLPSPTGGWNARDSYAEMPVTDAVKLTNWFPSTNDVFVRQGYVNWATGITGQVNSLMSYSNGSARKMFAGAGANVYDVSGTGVVGAAVVSGRTSDKWIHANISTPGGQFLVMCNGVDPVYNYNGTTWTTPSITGTIGTLSYVSLIHQRLWFAQTASLVACYLPVQSIAGAVQPFDLGPVFTKGGYLISISPWAVSGGFGISNYTVFLTSEGQIAIYQGFDPSQAASFNLIGVYDFGTPVGRMPIKKSGTDLLYICKDGLVSLSQGRFFSDVSEQRSSITDKIQGAISNVTTNFANNFGWQIETYPLNNMLILNVPSGIGYQQQYVMNTITGAWCNFTGWAANCWGKMGDDVFFGANGVVCKAWVGYSDNGANINADAIGAFNSFRQPSIQKHLQMARPTLTTNGNSAFTFGFALDYDITQMLSTPTLAQSESAVWGSSLWNQSTWGSGNKLAGYWTSIAGVCYTAAQRISVSSASDFHWAATDVLFEVGKPI